MHNPEAIYQGFLCPRLRATSKTYRLNSETADTGGMLKLDCGLPHRVLCELNPT